MANNVFTVDGEVHDESAAERFAANHTLGGIAVLLGIGAGALYYVRTDIPQIGQWWNVVAIAAGVLLAVSVFVDPLIGVWRRWKVVAADAGLRRSRGGVPVRLLVYPAGWRTVGLIVSSDTFMRPEWETAVPALAQGFGYRRAQMKHSGKRVSLVFTNRPSPIDGECVEAIDLDGQRVHVGITENGADYYLDTDGHSGMVVAGIPGSGKTVFLRRLVKTFAQSGANKVVVFDGKGTDDFFDLKKPNVEIYSGTPDMNSRINIALERLRGQMNDRAKTGENAGRVVIVVDECQGYVPVAGLTAEEKKAREQSLKALKEFVAKGRSLGFLTILATQKPDATTIPTPLRDICGLRACGRVRTPEAEKMVLGESPGLAQNLQVGQMIIDDGKDQKVVKVAQD